VAVRAWQEIPLKSDLEKNLTLVGLFGMIDPPRAEVRQAVQTCQAAGIRPVMITGDHPLTAMEIARQLGIISSDSARARSLTGQELSRMDDAELQKIVSEVSVYARVSPEHKLRIVQALQVQGEIVSMTGDGVNDAPALKSASIGIAMGITGTDVAKEASDMVLADDNFATIVAAVEEGRAVFNRLRGVIFFLISTNLSELVALVLAILFMGELPLLPVQLLWVNLVTDSAAAIPLGLEPKSGTELSQPPRNPEVGLIYPGLITRIIFVALLMGAGTFFVFSWSAGNKTIEEARTIAFTAMVTYQWFAAFYARSDEIPLFKLGFLSNRYLVISIAVAIMLQIAVIYIPVFAPAFGTYPLSISDWGIVISAGLSLFVIEELRKFIWPGLFSRGKWQKK